MNGFESGVDREYTYINAMGKPEEPPIPVEDEIDPKPGEKKTPKGPVTEATLLRRRKNLMS